MSQFNYVPDPTNNGKPVVDEEKAKQDLDNSLRNHAAEQSNSIVMGAEYYDNMNRLGNMTSGDRALRAFNARMEAFAKAFEAGATEGLSSGDKIRLDIATAAEEHASNNKFFVESVHSGAWEQARSMTSDEHWGIMGTDLRARNQFMHDASENSDVGRILGIENTPEWKAAVAARGVDTTQEGSVGDSLSNPWQSLFNYDDIADMVTKREDPTWTAAAQDNAWESMNSSEQGRYLVAATGMKRETLSRFTNADALIYGMNRLYKEAKFQQHAESDNYGGMLENFGQMLPTILNDPDTIGEVGMALLLAIPSGGASVYVGAAAKAGSLTNRALKIKSAAKGLATAGRLLPTRVLGDFVVPGLKALKSTKGSSELLTTSSRLRHAWDNLDQYDNWVTFAMGASADGVAGGVGAFLMNTQQIDDLNSVVYGKGVMSSVRNFDMVTMRGLMGIGGALTLGSALRVGFKGLSSMADSAMKEWAKSDYAGLRGAENKKAASTAVTAGVTRKILAKSGIDDEGIVTSVVQHIERNSEAAGVAPHKVAARLKETVGDFMDDLTGNPTEKAVIINEFAKDIIKEEFNSPDARDARELRRQATAKEIEKGKTTTAREKAEDAQARDQMQTGAMVNAHKVEDQSVTGLGKASQETAEAADTVADDLINANAELDTARAKKRQADEDRKAEKVARKKSEEQRNKEVREAEEAAKKENEKREAAAQEAKQKQIEEQERALAEAEETRVKAEVEAARAEVEKAKAAPIEVEKVEPEAPVTPPSKKQAKKAQAEASVEVATREAAVQAVREAMAKKLGVDEIEVDAIAAQVVSHRMLGTAARSANDVLDGFENEGLPEIPLEVLRHVIVEIEPDFARSFKAGEDGMVSISEARNIIKEARIQGQGQNFRGLTEDPNTVFLASRYTRGSYEAIAKQLKERAEEGPAGAYKIASQLSLLTGGGSLRDYHFRDGKAYLKGTAYYKQAIDNIKEMQDLFDVAEIKTERSLDDMRSAVVKDYEEVNPKSMVVDLRRELQTKFGYPAEIGREWSGVTVDDLVELVAYHRYTQQVDDLMAAGKLNEDQRMILGIDPDQQRIYFMNVLGRIDEVVGELRSGGHSRWIGEVEMLDIARAYYGPEASTGTNLRDSVFGSARGTNKGTNTKFDIAEVRRIAEERLGRLDADFNQARSMAARQEMARLEGKEEPTLEDRVKMAQYRNSLKVVNEIDYLETEVVAPYKAVSKEAADAKRAELGEEGWQAYLAEEMDRLYLRAFETLWSREGLGDDARSSVLKEMGVPTTHRKGEGYEATDEWKKIVTEKFVDASAEQLGHKPVDFVNGNAAFVRGRQAGEGLVLMHRDGAAVSGDRAAGVSADSKNRSRGEAYAHVRYDAARVQNPSGNLKIQKLVKFIENYMLKESERQVMFTEDGSLRRFSTAESTRILEWYDTMQDWTNAELADNVPNHPFEQKARGLHLVARAEKGLGSPVKSWVGAAYQRALEYQHRMIQEPVHLHQGIHDDLTIRMKDGVALNDMGMVGPMTMRYSQGAGSLDGQGAGWQTLATVPGSIGDWLNIRSGMIFRQFDGMDAFSRALGLKSLKEIRDVYVEDVMAKQSSDADVEIPAHIAELKGQSLKDAAKAAGITGKLKVGEIRQRLANLESGSGMTREEAETFAQGMTLIDLDKAVRLVDQAIRQEAFKGTLADPKKFDEILNSWDAASQAVALAKGLLNAAIHSAKKQNEAGLGDANVKDLTSRDLRAGIEDVKTAMGWDKTNGMLTEDIRMAMLSESRSSAEIGEVLKEEELAVVAADFYSTVWDGMAKLDPEVDPEMGGRMSGFITEDDGNVVATPHAWGNKRFYDPDMTADGANMWNFLFDEVGKFGSKDEIGEGVSAAKADAKSRGVSEEEMAADPAVAKAKMKVFLRNKLMKRPVMTRAYGAGGDAMSGAIADFLEEAFSLDTPEAAAFRDLIKAHNPALAKQLEQDATTGNRQASSALYQAASSLGWAFADKANADKWQGEGGQMGAILDMPDAKHFRDYVRNTNSLYKAAFDDAADLDLRIEWRGHDIANDGRGSAYGKPEMRNITFDDLYTQRSEADTQFWPKGFVKKTDKPEVADAKREASEKATRENHNSHYNQIREKAIEVAKRRGWSDLYDDDILDTLGRWHMRNLLLVEAGHSTEANVRAAERQMSEDMGNIIDKSETPLTDVRDFLENWLTRRDEMTMRAMNAVGFRVRWDHVGEALQGVGLTRHDLDPKFRGGSPLHSSVHSAAGRGFTGGGQGAKGWINPERGVAGSVVPVYRAMSDEFEAPAMELTTDPAYGWHGDKSTPETREQIALQLAVQDVMLDHLGMVKPPLHLLDDAPAFEEPTVEGFYRDWAENDHRAVGIREGMDQIRKEYEADYKEKNGVEPDDRADILFDDIRSQVPDTRSRTLFGQEDDGIYTDAGIPQLQLYRLRRTTDNVMHQKLKAARDNKVTGVGISMNELAVPSMVKAAGRMHAFGMDTPKPVAPGGSLDGMRMENDAAWLFNWTMREVIDFGNSIGMKVKTDKDFAQVFRLMHTERALQGGLRSGQSKLKDAKHLDGLDLNNPEDAKTYMDIVQRDISSYLEELMGETEVAANKEHGTRDVQQIPDTGTAYPADSFLKALREQYVNDPTANWMHADALLGPAPKSGIVLRGGDETAGGLLTGLMAKSVFGNDYGIGMGGADEAVRFGHWYVMRKFDVSEEEAAFRFNELFARRLEDDPDGVEFEKALAEWQGGEVDATWTGSHVSSLASVGLVRENLANDPEAFGLARDLFGIERIEELTNEKILELINNPMSDVSTLKVEQDKRSPDAHIDSLGRALTLTRVPLDTLLWRTMDQYRNAGIDPKSQPMIRRMWFAAQLGRQVEKIDIVGSMGARETRARAFSHMAADNEGKISETRIEASRKTISKVTNKANTWNGFREGATLDNLAVRRGNQILGLYEEAGVDLDEYKIDVLVPDFDSPSGEKMVTMFNPDFARAAWAFHATGRDPKKMFALGKYGSRTVREGLEGSMMTPVPVQALSRNPFGDDGGTEFIGKLQTIEADIDLAVKDQLSDDLRAVMGILGEEEGMAKVLNREKVRDILETLPERETITDTAAAQVVDDLESAQNASDIVDGRPGVEGPIFGGGRSLINEFDKIIREKRYPAISALTEELQSKGVFKDDDAAREFGMMLAMNNDLLGDLLPGVKFQYTGETGTARMQSIVENSTQNMLHRIQVLKDMRGMEGAEVFDIIVHELGHAIVHRGMAKGKGKTEGSKRVNGLMTSLRSQFQRRVKRGTPEDQKAFADAFVAIHGEEKGNALYAKFWNDMQADIDSGRAHVASQEFAAQMMSWYMLSRTADDSVALEFGEELATLYRAGYGERVGRVAKVYEEADKLAGKGMKVNRLKPRDVLKQLARIANTVEPVRWSGKKAFNEMFYNHSSNPRSKEALLAELAAVEKAGKEADPEDLGMLRNKYVSIKNRLAELDHATPSESSIARMQLDMLDGPRAMKTRALKRSGLDADARADLIARLKGGEVLDHSDFGRVDMKKFTDEEKRLLVDHMIDGKIKGRHETIGDSKVRSAIMMIGEGAALQGTSSAWRSSQDDVTWAANLLSNHLGFEERSGAGAHDVGMSQEQIQRYMRSAYGKAMSASIELFEMSQGKDAAFIKAVDDAFEESFNNVDKAKMEHLALINPHAANLVEAAASDFRTLYDRAYSNAVKVGEMENWVAKDLTGDGSRQLPIQLSQIVKEDASFRSMADNVSKEIVAEQLRRLRSDAATGERAGFVNVDFLQDYGILAPIRIAEASNSDGRLNHVENLDSVYGSDLVDSIIDKGKLLRGDHHPIQFGRNRSDDFYFSSELISKAIREGKFHSGDMPVPMFKAYESVMEGRVEPALMSDKNEVPFFYRQLEKDFPDLEDRARIKAILNSGSSKPTPADYEAAKMLHRSRYGGYSFANSKFMNAPAFSRILSQGIEGRGVNRTPLNVLKTFMAFDHGITDKFFNQEYYGITGMGYGDVLNALRSRVDRARMSEKGTMVKLTEREQAQAHKQIKSLEDQWRLAMGRNPSYKDDAGNDLIEAVAPYVQTAVGLVTTPNWTTASLVVEGTAGLVSRAARMLTQGTSMKLPKYAGDMGAMRDSMHAIGITMPYHMTKLGFGHIWNMGEEAAAGVDLDPSLKESRHDKTNKKLRRLGSFAFERVQLAQREAAMIPAQQFLRKMLIPGKDGLSKAQKMAAALNEEILRDPSATITTKDIQRLAKSHGVDGAVATQLWGMGMLSMEGTAKISDFATRFMPDNQFLKYEDMFNEVAWEPREGQTTADYRDELTASGKAATGLQELLFNQVSRTNMEPRVGTANVSASPLVRMWQSLSQYSIQFMRETMSALTTMGLGATVGMLMPLYFGEVIWYSLNRMKNGESPETIMQDWRDDAPGQMITALARMPVFGAGSMLNDLLVSNLTSAVGKISDGAVFSSKADERQFGVSPPGMPGPSMMFQAFGSFTDLIKQGGAALAEGDFAEAARQAKEFAYDFTPADFRPILVAGLRAATSDWKEQGSVAPAHRTGNYQIPSIFGALPEYVGPEPKYPRAKEKARNYGQLKADYITGINPKGQQSSSSGKTGGHSVSPASGPAAPQAGSSGLSGPKVPSTSTQLGPGSAGSPLMDRLGK